ncbi:MAG: FAD:protein FMN transferase [Pirellulales bacterium]|nr:FAD:protein FMN transferase [Pirellulales bacterium]
MAGKPRTTRRDFLQGRIAGDSCHPSANPTASVKGSEYESAVPDMDQQRGSEGYLLVVSRQAMACKFTVHLNMTAGPLAVEAAMKALDQVESLEEQMSVYRESSEVNEINRRAGGNLETDRCPEVGQEFSAIESRQITREHPRPTASGIPVEPQLFKLLLLAQQIAVETAGAFDITSGPLSRAWGFWRRQGRLPDEKSLAEALRRVGYNHVLLDGDSRTIRFHRPDIEIQLNGIGKGFALDRAAEILLDSGVHDFLLHGGQSSVLARGNNATHAEGGWKVGIRHPLRPKERLGEVLLRDKALGTSGSATQSFYAKGRRWGHILDPRSGMPAEGVFTSTVLAPTAAEADALATAFYVLGPDGTAPICSKRPEITALLVCPGERSGEIRLHPWNLAEEIWQSSLSPASAAPIF